MSQLGDPRVEIIRSPRRTKQLSARFSGNNTIEVRVPAGMAPEHEAQEVAALVARLMRRAAVQNVDNAELMARASSLNKEILQGAAQFTSVRWVSNQHRKWASCTPGTGKIRISDRLQGVPDYVLDAVIIHELVHTFIPGGHSKQFWRFADLAPGAERAKGYLEAYSRFC